MNGSPELHRVRANGQEHTVLEWPSATRSGNKACQTAVLVHGFADAAGTWDLVAPRLAAAGLRVLAPDMRGFGTSQRVASGGYYHFPDYVFDLADLVEELSAGEPIMLVGHSMGGSITTMYAGAFPERVARFVNIEGLGPPDNGFELGPVRMRSWVENVRHKRARPVTTFTREEALARLAANHRHVPPEVIAHRLPHLVQEVAPGRFAWHYDPLHRTSGPTPFFARLFEEHAKRITAPVLFVSGGTTGYHLPDEAARLAFFPSLETAEIPGAGHMVHWTEPERLAELLLAHST